MNSQRNRTSPEAIEAAQRLGLDSEGFLDYYAWPQVFGSTAGPFSGIGGQALTAFTIEAWADGNRAAIFCCGRYLGITEKFDRTWCYSKQAVQP